MRLLRRIIRWLFRKKMTSDIRLYIGDYLADLGDDPKLYYNWQLTDFTNPTVTKNSYSKSITLPSTKNNNKIFGHFWNFERQQEYGGNNGIYFNPTYRVPFSVFINGNMFEKGYMKLEKVNRTEDGKYEFQVNLNGGLGNFLYNLSADYNDGQKKTLASLRYFIEDQEQDLGFTITKEFVKEAWDNIDLYSSRHSLLNFAACENGLNDKMDCNKAVVNMKEIALFKSGVTEDNVNYYPVDGYVLANLPEKLLESEVADYRSWAQRPVIRVKGIIDAITRKENNKGKFDDGYDVVLDPEFFNSRNPYYEDAWMTLPMIPSLQIQTSGNTSEAISTDYVKSYISNDGNGMTLVYDLGEAIMKFGSSLELKFDLMVNVPDAELTARYDNLFPTNGRNAVAYAIQGLVSSDTNQDTTLQAGTPVAWLSCSEIDFYNGVSLSGLSYFSFDQSERLYRPFWDTEVSNAYDGHFVRYSGKNYRWNSQIVLNIDVPVGARYFRIRIDRVSNVAGMYKNYLWAAWEQGSGRYMNYTTGSTLSATSVANRTFALKVGEISNFFSGKEVKKEDLLNTSFSPAEFLLDYARMFGLLIHKDLYDDKIFIDTRNTYFKRNKIEDISERIDYSKEMEITPVACEAGFYRMKDSFAEGMCYKDYNSKFGKIYGSKIIATGYEFDAETKDLINSKFRAGVQTRRNGKYYFRPLATWDEEQQHWTYFHPYVFDGVTYELYAGGIATGDTIEQSINKKVILDSFEPFEANLPYYDITDRIEFCDADKKPLDGNYVLLFRYGDVDLSNQEYYLTDDLNIMSRLNNNPCYILTDSEYDANGNKIAIGLYSMPKFTRYWYGTSYLSSGVTQNNILYSMDWGAPRQLYILFYTDYEKSNLYSQFYKKYYTDLYSVDTRVVTLYLKPKSILSNDSLRTFYWFDNSVWRLNRVIDYSPISSEVVKCEFVKVQDLDNMTNEIPSKELTITVTLDKYSIAGSGGTIVATVNTSDMGPWSVEGWDYDNEITISPLTAATDGTFNITVPVWYGPGTRTVGITVAAGDISTRVYFTQEPETAITQSISITAATPISSAATVLNYTVSAIPSGNVYLLSGNTLLDQDTVSGHQSKSFAITANNTASARTYTLSGVTTDGLHSAVKSVVQNPAGSGPTPPTPTIDYNIDWGMISLDKIHSDIDGWTLPEGSIEVYKGASLLGSATMYGDESGVALMGLSFTGNSLSAASITFDFSQMSWNTALHPDICLDITVNNDETVTLTYSMDGLTGGFGSINLEQYAQNDSITLDFTISVRANN